MSRITTPATISDAPEASQPLLKGVEKMLGSAPNMFRLIGNSSATLEGYLGLNGALQKGKISAATRERIALAVANTNGCDYCNSAHTFLAKTFAKLDEAELAANRAGSSSDAKAHAAVAFAVKVATNRGQVSADDISSVKAAGYSDAEVVEIVAHVALNVLTNYINEVFKTDIDFPVVELAEAA
ncbi:carboxymuconolactone decarboxylase family protein [Cognatiyoonia sp. IB215182]|uniref:carboxymuconolactone decarboxylase family protein n=1 Tax=Cognatiyoonia sp. IB215182 TaxID=3097353 RepID=UPI002A16066A|nr:carboxymuconolactone decarboxylase family protein [Cognatiyoonia sp. IB215182]MDX8350831.1 carboxymuconolactone decarboxylase family protein [Cognatiyoonia sp. IB215182]